MGQMGVIKTCFIAGIQPRLPQKLASSIYPCPCISRCSFKKEIDWLITHQHQSTAQPVKWFPMQNFPWGSIQMNEFAIIWILSGNYIGEPPLSLYVIRCLKNRWHITSTGPDTDNQPCRPRNHLWAWRRKTMDIRGQFFLGGFIALACSRVRVNQKKRNWV